MRASAVGAVLSAALALAGCGGETESQEHARAIAYARMMIGAGQYDGGRRCCHVVGAERLAPRLWQVEVKRNEPGNHRSCAQVQLDRFYLHFNGDKVSFGGYSDNPGPCP